jgi:small subunit ribosomal protein S19e
MVTVYDVEPNKLIEATAKELENIIEMPEWAKFVKTGHGRERPPMQDNWWYLRAAAILRQVYINGPVGVSRLRTKYGNRKNRGHAPERHVKASGKIIRTILQQLEKAGLIEYKEIKRGKNVYKGRVVTNKGKSFLDKIATKIYNENKN